MQMWPYDVGVVDELTPLDEASATLRDKAIKSAGLPSQVTDFLAEKLPGRRIVLPRDTALYEKARKTFNARYDVIFPGAVVYCAQEGDVSVCIDAATRFAVPFRIRASGHSFGGASSLAGGIVVDISAMKSIRMLPQQEVYVEAGCNMSDLQKTLNSVQLQLPTGGSPVAIAGFMQGGGFSNLVSRTLGMQSDSVTGIWMMLAQKTVVRASESVNHDLWWAVRGGTGGNFGVLLAATYRLHPARESIRWSCSLALPDHASRATAIAALAALQDIVLSSGPEFNAAVDMRYWPEYAGGVPETLRLYVAGNYYGNSSDLESILRPLTRLLNGGNFQFHSHNKRLPLLRKARFTSGLNAQDWTNLVESYADHANLHSVLTIDVWGGAINSYPVESSAFVHRDAVFNIYVTGFWEGETEEAQMQTYLKHWEHALEPVWTGGIYQNFADPDLADYARHYWARAYPALAACKQKYDPGNLFVTDQAVVGSNRPVSWPPRVAESLRQPIQ